MISLPPASRGKSVRKSKRSQDVGRDEKEDGASSGSANGSRGIGPFFIGNDGAIVRIGQIHIDWNLAFTTLSVCSFRRRSFPRDDGGEKAPGVGDTLACTVVGVLLSARLKSVVAVFFKRYALIVESAHLGVSVRNHALTCEFAFLVGEPRIAAIEGHLRH